MSIKLLNSYIDSSKEPPFIKKGNWVEKWIPIFCAGVVVDTLSKIENHYEIESWSVTRFGEFEALVVTRVKPMETA